MWNQGECARNINSVWTSFCPRRINNIVIHGSTIRYNSPVPTCVLVKTWSSRPEGFYLRFKRLRNPAGPRSDGRPALINSGYEQCQFFPPHNILSPVRTLVFPARAKEADGQPVAEAACERIYHSPTHIIFTFWRILGETSIPAVILYHLADAKVVMRDRPVKIIRSFSALDTFLNISHSSTLFLPYQCISLSGEPIRTRLSSPSAFPLVN